MEKLKEQLAREREAAAKAIADAKVIREELGGLSEWPAEKQEKFDKCMADFAAHNTAVGGLEGKIEALSAFDAAEEQYSRPQPSVPSRIVEGQHEAVEVRANVESLARYLATPERHRAALPRKVKEEAQLAHVDAFERYLRGGDSAISPEEHRLCVVREQHALSSVTGNLGGFLVPPEFRAQVVKDLAGFAVIRGLARVEPTGSNMLQLPSIVSATTNADIYSSGYTGAWKAEGYVTGGTAPTVQNQPTFGLESIPVHIWQPNAVELPVSLLEDAQADVNGIISEVIAETWGLDEDSAFINGTGTGQPRGLLQSSLTAVNTGSGTALTYGGLIDLIVGLPAQYRRNSKLLMASTTYGAVLKLADSSGAPLIPPNTPIDQVQGKPIVFSEFMPAVAASANVIIHGDFRYYGIADRQELRIQRLTERYAPNIGILAMARVGGQVLRTAAFRVQTVSA